MADYYDVLELERDASQEEIKRAYRRLAREHHPDRNREDPHAEERFKEITRAYEVLSDPERRQRYDLYGDEKVGAEHFADFGGISDLFTSFFGAGVQGRNRRGPARGADVLAEIEITLEEAASGGEREVEVTNLQECPDCRGSGAAPGTFPTRCSGCGGTGEVRQVSRTFFGNVMTASACPVCRGTGEQIVQQCRLCSGQGRVPVNETLTVQIPPGIDEGAQIRVSGRGQAGVRGGRSGDLYVGVRIAPHETFSRVGDDLGCEVRVPMTIAALGGDAEIPTLDGPELIEIDPGTQSGEVVRLKAKGMPRLHGRGRGELVALLKVETPRDLDGQQVELLRRLAQARGEDVGQRGFLGKIKEAFK